MMRLYVLINVKRGAAEKVACSLRKRPGVLFADVVEKPPDVVMLMQAINEFRLTRLIIKALVPVENFIDGIQLIPAKKQARVCETPYAYSQN
jgi:hypothetical protein